MTVGDTLTSNLRLTKVSPTRKNWADAANKNMDILDAVVGTYFKINEIKGVWDHSVSYAKGDVVVDDTDGSLWRCQVTHISMAVPNTFTIERSTYSTYWSRVVSIPSYRGTWVTNATYDNNEFVYLNYVYYVCRKQHTSGTFATDLAAGDWEVFMDLGPAYAAQTAATAAAASATASAASASTDAATASAAAISATASASSATTSASTASTAATNASTSATNASSSASTASTAATTATTAATSASASAVTATSAAQTAGAYLGSFVSQCQAVLQQLAQNLAAGVASFNGRTGIVTMTQADYQGFDDQIIIRNQVFG